VSLFFRNLLLLPVSGRVMPRYRLRNILDVANTRQPRTERVAPLSGAGQEIVMDRPRIVLADDHPEFLNCTATMLEAEFDVVESVGNGQALIEAAGRLDPDIVVLDISMPVLNGFDAARRLASDACRARLVFLTVHQDEDLVRRALELGAQGYVVKPRLASDLVHALREVLAGRSFVSKP
ncbi:MAG: response regulator transcription factor, partial [Planctomycetaceae bacterium]|nr:response regulator transcription factor [Planctomycetaceae bacterium]